MYASRISIICLGMMIILMVSMYPVGATKMNNTTILKQKIEKLQSEIQSLKNDIARLKAENTKLQIENQKLQSELQQYKQWDARILMDKLLIFHLTPSGKKYELIFHEGGLGGITVYQYVGPWLGDAGQWRQYKQIAQLKTSQLKHGYLKPGIELKPVWGFNRTNITIRTIGDILRIEKKFNTINGLALYVNWLRNKYIEASHYSMGLALSVCLVIFGVGLVMGEITRPIYKLRDRISTGAMTYWGEKRRISKLTIISAGAFIMFCIMLGIILPLQLAIVMFVVIGLVTIALLKYIF